MPERELELAHGDEHQVSLSNRRSAARRDAHENPIGRL